MNLDELQSVQSRERQASSLQNLRSSFYQDAGEFIQQLTRERDRAAERADDPFSSPEVRRLSDDIQTAKQTVEAIYERRVGKVVKMASIAAADMPTDDEGLTDEEAQLFDTLVARIKENRSHVLDEVLEGEGSDLSCARDVGAVETTAEPESPSPDAAAELGLDPTPDSIQEPSAADDPVNAADMMGAGTDDSTAPPAADESPETAAAADESPETTAVADEPTATERTEVPPEEPPSGGTSRDDAPPSEPLQTDDATDTGGAADADETPVERTTVHVLQDVGEIFGVDERTYELTSDEVVTLPAANAEPLVEREAAKRLE